LEKSDDDNTTTPKRELNSPLSIDAPAQAIADLERELVVPHAHSERFQREGQRPDEFLLCVDLPQIAPLFPRFGCLDREPGRELVGIGIELA